MKPILSIIVIAMFLLSCGTDIENKVNTKPTSLNDILLGNVNNLLPQDNYKTKSYVVYVNDQGIEKYLKIEYHQGMISKKFSALNFNTLEYDTVYLDYNSEALDIHLRDTTNETYFPSVKVQSYYYSQQGFPNPGVSTVCNAMIFTGINSGFMPSITFDSNGEVLIGTLKSNLTIAGRNFTNVSTNVSPPSDFTSYTKIYYSTEFGIVGFEGENHEMWAFDRFE